MKVVICPDSFKESATALEASQAVQKGFQRVFVDASFELIPLADGGEGTSEVLTKSLNGKFMEVSVSDPLNNKRNAKYGFINDQKLGIIEVAEAIGLHLIKPEQRNPMITTSYGVGELINDAIKNKASKILIGIGGSSTNDCGVGMLSALGAKFYDKNNLEIKVEGYILDKIESINIDNVLNKLQGVKLEIACDVKNPLFGEDGASKVYAKQKGATPEMIDILEEGVKNFHRVVKKDLGVDLNVESSGASGALGAAFILLNSNLVPGIDLVLKYTNFKEKIKNADLIITGEGAIDHQTAFGKTISQVSKHGKDNNIPVIVLAGRVADDLDNLYEIGVTAIFGIVDGAKSLDQALKDGIKSIEKTSFNIAKLIERRGM